MKDNINNKEIKIYKILNSILIVDNGIKKVINDTTLLQKTNNQILEWYKDSIKRGGDEFGTIE
jgi:hypothetical protein